MDKNSDSWDMVREQLAQLNFGAARETAEQLAQSITDKEVENLVEELENCTKNEEPIGRDRKSRLLNILTFAEVCLYYGDIDRITYLLSPFTGLKSKNTQYVEWTNGFHMRTRLQLADFYYRNRQFADAVDLLDKLEGVCLKSNQTFEEGEIEYFRIRIALREAKYENILRHAMKGLDKLTSSEEKLKIPPVEQQTANQNSSEEKTNKIDLVRWRLAQIMLVFGTGAYRHGGDPTRGSARLHLARWLFYGTPDTLGQAHAEQELGMMHRSHGGEDSEKAFTCFQKALALYTDLKLKHGAYLSRIHTSLGTYYLSQKNYSKANDSYATALTYADDDFSSRQRAAIYVRKSWLAQAMTTPDLTDAIHHADTALDLLRKGSSHHTHVDALLALGSAYLAKGEHVRAEKYLAEGQKLAKERRLQKYEIHAHLCLAELYVDRTDKLKASEHFRAALEVIPDGIFPESAYLRTKRDRIKSRLEESTTFYLTLKHVLDGTLSLKDYHENLEAWLIEQMTEREHGKINRVADKLKVPRQRISKYFTDKKRRESTEMTQTSLSLSKKKNTKKGRGK